MDVQPALGHARGHDFAAAPEADRGLRKHRARCEDPLLVVWMMQGQLYNPSSPNSKPLEISWRHRRMVRVPHGEIPR